MTKAMPSAVGVVPGVIWKLKSVVKLWMLAGTLYQADPAS